MTTPRTQTAREAIMRALARDPDISANAILRELQEQGLGIRRQTVQDIVRASRGQIRAAARALEEGIESRITRFFPEAELRLNPRLSEDAIRRTLRQSLQNFPEFQLSVRGTTLTGFTYARIEYQATIPYTTYINRTVYEEGNESISGVFTTEVGIATDIFIADRIKQQAEGILNQRIGQQSGLGNGSVIDGLHTDIGQIIIQSVRIEGRGQRASVGPDTGNLRLGRVRV